jgi:hypothetical protein
MRRPARRLHSDRAALPGRSCQGRLRPGAAVSRVMVGLGESTEFHTCRSALGCLVRCREMGRKARTRKSSRQDHESDAASIVGGFSYSSDPPGPRAPVAAEVEQPLPEWLREPAQALLDAFEQPSRIGLSLTCRPQPEVETALVVTVHLEAGGGWGFGVDTQWPLPDLLVSIAGGIQEHLPEERETWGQPRPACPAHAHEAVARVIDGGAWWICPELGTPLKLIVPS